VAQDFNVRGKPTLRQITVTNLGQEKLGRTIYYQVEAFNLVGSTKSESAAFLFAAVPPAPA
jgi:hypothetical protein